LPHLKKVILTPIDNTVYLFRGEMSREKTDKNRIFHKNFEDKPKKGHLGHLEKVHSRLVFSTAKGKFYRLYSLIFR
jgi:hypothetical protein